MTIPSKAEWSEKTISQLLDIKLQLTDTYYKMRGANASFAKQYLVFISDVDRMIAMKEQEIASQPEE